MGTIMQRQKKDGATRYTAVIRRKQGGEVVPTPTENFQGETAAERWVRKTERGLSDKEGRPIAPSQRGIARHGRT